MLELEKEQKKSIPKHTFIKWVNSFIEQFPVIWLNLIIIAMSGGIILGITIVTYTIYGVFILFQHLFNQ